MDDNCMDLWIMNKKRPIYSLNNIFANNGWALSTDAIKNSDLIAAGGFDGTLPLIKFEKEKKQLREIARVRGLAGCLNNVRFSQKAH